MYCIPNVRAIMFSLINSNEEGNHTITWYTDIIKASLVILKLSYAIYREITKGGDGKINN